MKKSHVISTVLTVALILALSVSLAHAAWSSLNSGYAVTSDYHGTPVQIGESVTVWAGTTDSTVYKVKFIWKDASGTIQRTTEVSPLAPYTAPNVPTGVPSEISDWANNHPGDTVYYASDSFGPTSAGDWGVQVQFFAREGNIQQQDIGAIRAASFETFEAIPDVPVIGSIGAIAAMLLGFGVYLRKGKSAGDKS